MRRRAILTVRNVSIGQPPGWIEAGSFRIALACCHALKYVTYLAIVEKMVAELRRSLHPHSRKEGIFAAGSQATAADHLVEGGFKLLLMFLLPILRGVDGASKHTRETGDKARQHLLNRSVHPQLQGKSEHIVIHDNTDGQINIGTHICHRSGRDRIGGDRAAGRIKRQKPRFYEIYMRRVPEHTRIYIRLALSTVCLLAKRIIRRTSINQ